MVWRLGQISRLPRDLVLALIPTAGEARNTPAGGQHLFTHAGWLCE